MPGTRGDKGLGRYRVSRTYPKALIAAGAVPVHLLPVEESRVQEVLERVDGLLLCGGPDIDPAAYGEEPHPTVVILPAERQSFDFALAREAMRRRMPILGICLGSQELNVVRGGTLIQDVPSEVETDIDHRQTKLARIRAGVHEVSILKGTLLAKVYGDEAPIKVNSAHHQAVDDLGKGLRVAARASDGVIEGFDDPEYPFLVGVQFHPEAQTEPAGQHDPLFRAFVEAAAEYRRSRAAAER
jgi:putative glutamine amidotransferase